MPPAFYSAVSSASVRRRLFNILSAVSLVLCVATIATSVRSRSRGNQLRWATRHATYFVTVSGGDIMLLTTNGMALLPQDRGRWAWDDAQGGRAAPTGGLAITHRFLGFQIGNGLFTSPSPVSYHVIVIPLWIRTLLLCSRASSSGYYGDSRRQPGHCPSCGYDLLCLPRPLPRVRRDRLRGLKHQPSYRNELGEFRSRSRPVRRGGRSGVFVG